MEQLQKGSILWVHDWWYVLVNVTNGWYNCICDNANNVYSFRLDEIEHSFSPLEVVRFIGWSSPVPKLEDLNHEREIPKDVMLEVLAGAHDDRFK